MRPPPATAVLTLFGSTPHVTRPRHDVHPNWCESASGLGYTDMRKGLDGLAMPLQGALKNDPFSGHLFAFRGKRASVLKILFWDGNGTSSCLCLM
jgi:transposase